MNVVYRFYDANCRLLYIGASAALPLRLSDHAKRTPWFGEVDTISVEHVGSAMEARETERDAIRSERPAYNLTYAHPDWKPVVKERHRARRTAARIAS